MNAGPTVWDRLVGQDRALAVLQEAARSARAIVDTALPGAGSAQASPAADVQTQGGDTRAMSHAWLITGPPGSGRSTAALAFAAALQCTGPSPGCGQCAGCRTAMAKTNADITITATEANVMRVEQARELVAAAQSAPSQGRWRVLVVEDADRLNEQGANALLKAIEEPPERTVWLLCAPSAEDMIVTIRSRCRHLTLQIPSVQAVARLLVGEGIADEHTAIEAARAAQCHIGLARALARDPEKRRRRREGIIAPVRVRSVGEAVLAADNLVKIAKKQADSLVEERNERERSALLRQLGQEESQTLTRQSRTLVRQLEDEQKRRARRALTDALDRALVDLLGVYRDVLMRQLGTGQELINTDLVELVDEIAQDSTPRQTMRRVASIERARRRLVANGQALLVIEAMAVSLRPQL